jgi:polygalacturonase
MPAAQTLAAVLAHVAALPVFNILSYGAVPDNATLCTRAIQAAIDAAAASGGGSVLVPPGGAFLTATLALKSHVYLSLPTGATLQGSASLADYTAVSGADWGLWDVLHSRNATDSGIIGDAAGGGTLSGPMWQMIAGYDPVNNFLQPVTWAGGAAGCVGECRPRLVVFEDGADITVAHVKLFDSADWTQLYRRCINVLLEGVAVFGAQQWPNNDGVDFESCANVTVRDYTSVTGDDGIVLASGNCNAMRAPWPETCNAYSPTRDVLIERARISSHSSAIKYEAIDQVCHGSVFNVAVRDVFIFDSARGVGFQQRTGAGAAFAWAFSNVSALRTRGVTGSNWWGRGEALYITTLPEGPEANETLGGVFNISFADCVFEGEQGALVLNRGERGALRGLTFSNVTVRVGVYGNATRAGVHDLRPVNVGPETIAANVSGWFFEAADARVLGGAVTFVPPAQPTWARGACNATEDASVDFEGVECTPADFALSGAAPACNVFAFGAVGDGVADDTAAIRAALAACAAPNSTVLLPATRADGAPAIFSSAPLNLTATNLTFLVAGTLLASADPSAYPVVAGLPSYFPDYWRWQPFLWIIHAAGVRVAGGGTIDGRGDAYFWPSWFNGSLADPLNMRRPMLVEVFSGSDAVLEDFSTRRPAFWSIHLVYTTRFAARRLDVRSPVGSPNCDGIDPDSSSFGTIEDCVLAGGDDNIAIKSGRGPAGAAFGVASHHILVRNVTLLHGLGVTMGAEAAGGVHDVTVAGLVARNTLTAVHVQSPRWLDDTWAGGGAIERILFEDVAVQGVYTAIFFNQWWGELEATAHAFPTFISPPPARNATTPRFSNITVRGVRGLGSDAARTIDCFMVGNIQCLPEAPCTGVVLENISLSGYKHWACANAAGLVAEGVSPDPALDGCAGNDSVAAPRYHASAFN